MAYESCTVLVIEDEVVTRSVTVRLLRQMGIGRVIEAADGAEALARCDRLSVDAIFCDVEMTPMDGLAFLKTLRARMAAPSRDAPVIMLTKHSESDVVLDALRSGAAGYLVKPLTPEALRGRLDRAIVPPAPDRS